MLYDVLLHELGHLQIINPRMKDLRRKFAREPRAIDFAHHWRETLWSTPFEHHDPAHTPPPPEEFEATRAYWPQAQAEHKRGLKFSRDQKFKEAFACFTRAAEAYPYHSMAFEQLGIAYITGRGTNPSEERAIEFCRRALAIDPNLYYARYILYWWKGEERRRARARTDKETYFTEPIGL